LSLVRITVVQTDDTFEKLVYFHIWLWKCHGSIRDVRKIKQWTLITITADAKIDNNWLCLPYMQHW